MVGVWLRAQAGTTRLLEVVDDGRCSFGAVA
jgi:hypothetical protein